MDKNSLNKPNLYLVGFMGTGKSSIGRLLAETLGYRFIDSDYAIEEKTGRKISDIFADEGESFFRDLEREFVVSGHPEEECVVSCGGGLITVEETRKLLMDKGVVVSLIASAETIHERTKGSDIRPLLNVADPLQKIRDLLAEREPIYRSVGISVLTDGRPMKEIAQNIVRVYNSAASGE